MMPRRIAFLNPVGGLGGAEQSLLRLLRVVRTHSPETICRLLVGSDGPLMDEARAIGVEAERLPMPRPIARLGDSGLRHGGFIGKLRLLTTAPAAGFATLRTVGWMRNWLAKHPPDVIHSNGMKTHLLSALARPNGTPLIWHIRDFPGQRPLMRHALRRLSRRATLAIANSNAVADDARSVFPRLPVSTLYNMVDTEKFAPGPADPSLLDRLAGLPPMRDVLRIGLVATYANWKGHDVLLRAAAKLPDSLPFRVYLVGEPIYSTPGSQFRREDLAALARQLGIAPQVGFIPFQRDTATIYRSLDVVVHASTRPEPFGLTIVEAMACGRAVIVARAGGAAELFTDGVDALGHEPGNADDLAAVLLRLRDSAERDRLGRAARSSAVERFGETPFARGLADIYRQCLVRSASPPE